MREEVLALRNKVNDMRQQRDLEERVRTLGGRIGWAIVQEKEAVRRLLLERSSRMRGYN